MANGNANAGSPIDIRNMTLPKEGPRCLPVQCDFGLFSTYRIDGSQLLDLGRMSVIQGVYVDNSLGASPVIFTLGISGQTLTCPPYGQGYIALFLPNPCVIYVSCGNAALQTLYFHNLPIATTVWPTKAQGFTLDSNGNVLVSDTALAALISGGALKTSINNSSRLTYTANDPAVVSYATPTDIFYIVGSATKKISVMDMSVYIASTAAAQVRLQWVKRSTLSTGGAPTTATAFALDSANAAATAVCGHFTSAPAVGALVGVLNDRTLLTPALTATYTSVPSGFGASSTITYEQGVVLNNQNEGLYLTMLGAALPAGFQISGSFKWTEY